MRRTIVAIVLTCGCCAVAIAGCGGGGPPVQTVPVKGKITYRGKPLTKGTIHFEPDYGRPAQGEIAFDGSFTLTTYASGDGAVPGAHRVSVSGLTRATLPVKFASPNTSGLEIEVSPDKSEYDITIN